VLSFWSDDKEQSVTSIPFSARVRPSPDVLIQEVDGEAVLLNLQTGKYFGLDPVAFRMWQLLTSSDTPEEAFVALEHEYDVQQQTLRGDLNRLLEQLVEQQLLQVGEQ
jgi:hypothetical protein